MGSKKSNGKAGGTVLPVSQLRKAYRVMLLIRRFEEKAAKLYTMGLIGGYCHLYIGQEAVVVGIQMAVRKEDYIVTGYRDHGHMIACGASLKGVMAELLGRGTGCSAGKGGSMHMFHPERNFYGGHGIVGVPASVGTGLAFAARYKGEKSVCVASFGDGAANQGQVYESFNMAQLWKLPIVYVIENNQYAMGTSVERATAQTNLSQRGASFDIPGLQVNGMDLREVHAASLEALEWCRAGKGPILVEMLTYRYRGHSMSDPGRYRSREEIKEVRTHRDPIDILRSVLEEEGEKQAAFEEADTQVQALVEEAAVFAQSSREPEAKELYTHVLHEGDYAG